MRTVVRAARAAGQIIVCCGADFIQDVGHTRHLICQVQAVPNMVVTAKAVS